MIGGRVRIDNRYEYAEYAGKTGMVIRCHEVSKNWWWCKVPKVGLVCVNEKHLHRLDTKREQIRQKMRDKIISARR